MAALLAPIRPSAVPTAGSIVGFGSGRLRPSAPRRQPDYSRAPAAKKPETPPTSTVLVIGDSMADWLAYGLEEALADTPEIGVVRKHRANSGLVRYDPRNDTQDWAQCAARIADDGKAELRRHDARPPRPPGDPRARRAARCTRRRRKRARQRSPRQPPTGARPRPPNRRSRRLRRSRTRAAGRADHGACTNSAPRSGSRSTANASTTRSPR